MVLVRPDQSDRSGLIKGRLGRLVGYEAEGSRDLSRQIEVCHEAHASAVDAESADLRTADDVKVLSRRVEAEVKRSGIAKRGAPKQR